MTIIHDLFRPSTSDPLTPWFTRRRMAASLLLAAFAACVLIAINETGYRQSMAAVRTVDESQRTRTALNTLPLADYSAIIPSTAGVEP